MEIPGRQSRNFQSRQYRSHPGQTRRELTKQETSVTFRAGNPETHIEDTSQAPRADSSAASRGRQSKNFQGRHSVTSRADSLRTSDNLETTKANIQELPRNLYLCTRRCLPKLYSQKSFISIQQTVYINIFWQYVKDTFVIK